MPYYKIFNREELHNNLQYHDGINEDIIPFNPKGTCEPGGMYYSREDILEFIHYGCWIREVVLLDDSKIYKDPDEFIEKWKTNKFFLKPRRLITAEVVQELINQGANIHVSSNLPLRFASRKGLLGVVKVLLEAGADVHAMDDDSLRWASEKGHTEIVKVLLEAGADVNAKGEMFLRIAVANDHLEVVKLLLEYGSNANSYSIIEYLKVNNFCKIKQKT